MNRFVSVGLSIAVAPAILLGIALLAGWEDAITVSEFVLYEMALPIGAVLVLTGGLFAAMKGTHGRRFTARLRLIWVSAISSVVARGRTLRTSASAGRWFLAVVLVLVATLTLPINSNVAARNVAAVLLFPVFLVANSVGFGGVFAAPIVLAVLGWTIARRFPKPMAIVGGCLLTFPWLQWLSWDSIACKGPECNDLGLFVLWLGLALWVALPGLTMLLTGVVTLRKSREHHGA